MEENTNMSQEDDKSSGIKPVTKNHKRLYAWILLFIFLILLLLLIAYGKSISNKEDGIMNKIWKAQENIRKNEKKLQNSDMEKMDKMDEEEVNSLLEEGSSDDLDIDVDKLDTGEVSVDDFSDEEIDSLEGADDELLDDDLYIE